MTKYVISTRPYDVGYTFLSDEKDAHGIPVGTIRKTIKIRGGAGINSLTSGFGDMQRSDEGRPLWTADGVVTPISDENAEELKTNKVFNDDLRSGWVRIVNDDVTGNYKKVKKIVSDMEEHPHRPLDEARWKEYPKGIQGNQINKVSTGAPSDDF